MLRHLAAFLHRTRPPKASRVVTVSFEFNDADRALLRDLRRPWGDDTP